jgi:hypothetical protein
MVRSCEFLPKQGEQLSKSDSLENLSVKSDDGGQSKSKPQRKQNGSRIQQSKKHYSPARSNDSQSKPSFKDRNWHYPLTPGRSSNSRHDGCKQPTPGRYDRSFYNSPRHYGQQDSYSSRRGSNYDRSHDSRFGFALSLFPITGLSTSSFLGFSVLPVLPCLSTVLDFPVALPSLLFNRIHIHQDVVQITPKDMNLDIEGGKLIVIYHEYKDSMVKLCPMISLVWFHLTLH